MPDEQFKQLMEKLDEVKSAAYPGCLPVVLLMILIGMLLAK